MTPLETYLKAVREIRSSGEAVPETSYYGAFETLVNDIGETLQPRVRCVINIRNRGAGIPDGGFFTADQLTKSLPDHSQPGWGGQVPVRGVLELKSAKEDVGEIVKLPQVMGYLYKYSQVLISNFRQFLLVGRDSAGNAVKLEPYTLAETDSAFLEAMTHPQKAKAIHEKRLTEYLKRVMLSAAELRLPENLAWLLASYARDALERIHDADISDLKDIREKLQAFLGISFGGEQGEHFFRSTLIQTIFYGVFAAWVLWSREKQAARVSMTDRFDWRVTGFKLQVPVLKKLFGLVATGSNLEAFKLTEILNWAGGALNRVNRDDFFQNF
ncbi:MAG: DNA methyltransferase [Deltaproteobacteria bacterium]|nr:DNA methyltransferase [Deltaproteobacteria bacterium]